MVDSSKATERITLTCDAITALGVLGSLHLAIKHPLNTGPSTRLVRAFYEQLLGKVGESGLISGEELRQAFRMEEVELSRQEAQRRLKEEGRY